MSQESIDQYGLNMEPIGIFVDKNYNNKMDRNLFGVPKEQFGFSNNAKGKFGPPSFEDASFTVSSDMNLEINL